MGVGILAKRVVLELGSSTNFVYSLRAPQLIEAPLFPPGYFLDPEEIFCQPFLKMSRKK